MRGPGRKARELVEPGRPVRILAAGRAIDGAYAILTTQPSEIMAGIRMPVIFVMKNLGNSEWPAIIATLGRHRAGHPFWTTAREFIATLKFNVSLLEEAGRKQSGGVRRAHSL